MLNAYRSAADLIAERITVSSSLEVMLNAAAEAGRIAFENFGKSPTELGIQVKPNQTIVTHTDIAAQKSLINDLTTGFTDEAVLLAFIAEEDRPDAKVVINPAVIAIIDPLDGTSNFGSGNGTYVIALSLTARDKKTGKLKGKYTITMIPERDLYIVSAQEGTFEIDRRRQRVRTFDLSTRQKNKVISLIGDLKRSAEDRRVVCEMTRLLGEEGYNVQQIGSTVTTNAAVATGQYDGAIVYSGLRPYVHPWDIASCYHIVKSGGIVTTAFGEEDPLNNDPHSLIAAYDEKTHAKLLRIVGEARAIAEAAPIPPRKLQETYPFLQPVPMGS